MKQNKNKNKGTIGGKNKATTKVSLLECGYKVSNVQLKGFVSTESKEDAGEESWKK